MVAWCGNGDMPARAHVPFWSKKPRAGVVIEPLPSYSAKLITELGHQVELTMGQQEVDTPSTEPDAAAGSGKGDGGKGKGDGGKGDGGKGKGGTGPSKGRGGWLPKMGELLVKVYQDDYDAVRLLADVHYDSSSVLKDIVDKGLYS